MSPSVTICFISESFTGDSDAPLFRWPDYFMHLNLKTHGQGISNDFLGQLQPRDRRLPGRHFLQRLVLLFRGQWLHPRDEHWANRIQMVLCDGLFRPFIIFVSANHELYFVRALEMAQVLPQVSADFAAAWAFEVHNAPHTGI